MAATRNGKAAQSLGAILVITGLLANKWTLGPLLAPESAGDSTFLLLMIALGQLSAIVSGVYLFVRRPTFHYGEAILVAVSLAISLLLFEAGSRFWLNHLATEKQARKYRLGAEIVPGKMPWSGHHYLNYYPTPGYRKGRTAHNSLGYRDREFSVDKPEGSFRIVALGGSTTYTIKVEDNEKTFPQQLERILRDAFGHARVEVINAGVGGYSSWESLINLQFRCLDLDPDLVLIYHGTNDVHTRLVAPGSYRGDNSGRRKQWSASPVSPLVEHSYLMRIVSSKLGLGLFRPEGLGSYVNALTYRGQGSVSPATDPMELLEAHQPVYFRRNLTSMIAISRAHGAEVLLSTWAHSPYMHDYAATPAYQRGFQESNEVVREVAREQGVRLFDLARSMPQEKAYWADGRHVNEKGALEKARLFADFIQESGLLAPAD